MNVHTIFNVPGSVHKEVLIRRLKNTGPTIVEKVFNYYLADRILQLYKIKYCDDCNHEVCDFHCTIVQYLRNFRYLTRE